MFKTAKDFTQGQIGSKDLTIARRQQKQLLYLTESKVQDPIDAQYISNTLCSAKHDDPLLDWVGAIFKANNFKSFFKYLRFPVASARLVNDVIKPHLERVFFSEDSFKKYTKKGVEIPEPEELKSKEFNVEVFNALLFNFNDVVVEDLAGVNQAMRHIVSIDNVRSIHAVRGDIKRIAYSATIIINEEHVPGFIYIDDEMYAFFDASFEKEPIEWPHDLGRCPATFVSKKKFYSNPDDSGVVRCGVFSYAREEMEEYVFLKTLQRMTDPNGAIPIVAKPNTNVKNKQEEKEEEKSHPMSVSHVVNKTNETEGFLQAGTEIKVPLKKKNDGSYDIDLIKNFLTFFRTPTDALEYLEDRITRTEKSIIANIVGDNQEQNNESAKNADQIRKSLNSKQDKLRALSQQMTRIRTRSDENFLWLQGGPESIEVEVSYGTDFFLESEEDLHSLINTAPNPIERLNGMIRLAKNRGRFNPNRANRDQILYRIQPFASDSDLEKAIATGTVSPTTISLQLQLSYWITIFEATYGDILEFWEALGDIDDSQKLILINKLIIQIVKDHEWKEEGSSEN